MASPLSILVTKEPSSASIQVLRTTPKTAKSFLDSHDKGCSAFIETIADLDNAHFLTKFEMQELTSKLLGVKFTFPPRDRLVAAKALAQAFLQTQGSFPEAVALTKEENKNSVPTRCCPPQVSITPCKKGTKLAILVGLLAKGTTMVEMQKETGWAQGGVLSGLNYDLHKRKGIGYRITGKGQEETYTLVLPTNYQGPIIV